MFVLKTWIEEKKIVFSLFKKSVFKWKIKWPKMHKLKTKKKKKKNTIDSMNLFSIDKEMLYKKDNIEHNWY